MVCPLQGDRASGRWPGPVGIPLVLGVLLLLPVIESQHLFGLSVHSILKGLLSTCYKPGIQSIRDRGLCETGKVSVLLGLKF